MTGRRVGHTLPSLLVGLTLAVTIAALLGGVTVSLLRTAHRQQTRLRVRAQLAHAAGVLAWELRDLAPRATATDPGDLALLVDTAVEVRATVGGGVACAVAAGGIEVADETSDAAAPLAWWPDAPQPGDLLHVHDDGALPTPRDDAWHARPIAAVERSVGACALGPLAPWRGPGAHYRLVLAGAPLPTTVAGGAPLRVSRRRRYVHYRDGDGTWQLGQREWTAGTGALQPVAGPLAPATAAASGIVAQAWDASGTVLAGPVDRAARLRITLRARASEQPGAWHDSLAVHAALDARGTP